MNSESTERDSDQFEKFLEETFRAVPSEQRHEWLNSAPDVPYESQSSRLVAEALRRARTLESQLSVTGVTALRAAWMAFLSADHSQSELFQNRLLKRGIQSLETIGDIDIRKRVVSEWFNCAPGLKTQLEALMRQPTVNEELVSKKGGVSEIADPAPIPPIPTHVDERDPDAHPLDRMLGTNLKEALRRVNETQLADAMEQLVFVYGDEAKKHIRATFPDCVPQEEVQLLELALQRMSDEIDSFDDATQSVRIFFLMQVYTETIAFLRRAIGTAVQHAAEELPSGYDTDEGESREQADIRRTRNGAEWRT